MDDLNKLLFDLQESQPTLPSNGHSATLIKELDVIETQLSSKKKMVSNAPLTSIPRPRPTDISNSIERLKQAKVSSEKTLDSTSKAKLCEDCKQPIVRGGSILNGKSYHQEHFVCNICRKSLKGVLVFNKDGKLWCEKDYHKAYSPECFFCKEPIKEVRVSQHQDNGIEAVGKSFHPDHFFCAQCGISLINQTFIEYQGKVRYVFMKAFCSDDYATLFATRCAHCLQPLLEDYITAISKNYHKDHFICSATECGKVLSLNGFYNQDNLPYCEYHYYQLSDNICSACDGIILGRCVVAFSKKFHTAHFKCSFCQKQLDGISGGYKEKGDKPYCQNCFVTIM